MDDNLPTTDLDATVRFMVDPQLAPAVMAAGVCTAIGNQFAAYAAYESSASGRARAAGDAEKATFHEGTRRAYTRAATQMRDAARRLTGRPDGAGRWQAALAATPAPYGQLIRDLTDDEGAALAQCGVPMEPIARFGDRWRSQVSPGLVEALNQLITACGGSPPAAPNTPHQNPTPAAGGSCVFPGAGRGERQNQVDGAVLA